jgi:hypothetical protein
VSGLIVKTSRTLVIRGLTTNPTLMRKAGVSDYEDFARKVLAAITDRPVSFEVFADDFASMAEQAPTISAWGPNVNVKIFRSPTRRGQPSDESAAARADRGASRARAHCGKFCPRRRRRTARAALRLARIIAGLTAIGFHLETLQMGRQLWQEGARIALAPRGCCAL